MTVIYGTPDPYTTSEAHATDAELAAAIAGMSISGVLSSRPSAGTEGRFYFATDEGVLYRDTGSTWTRVSLSGGEERAYSSKSNANFVTAVNAARDVTDLDPITFDVNAGEVAYVRFRLPWNTHDTIAGSLAGYITDGSSVIKQTTLSTAAYTGSRSIGPVFVEERITDEGSYTRKGMTQTFVGNATSVATATASISIGAYIYR